MVHPGQHARVRRLQQGLTLLKVLLLVAVLGGLSLVGYLEWRERTLVETSRQEHRALSQADQAIITFATVMRRLPCPDADGDGLEDCGTSAQKGWLPSQSLRQAGADPGVDIGRLRYLVQRGGGDQDLTVLSDTWRPLEYDDGAATFFNMRDANPYPDDILNLADLCQRLAVGVETAYASGRAAVRSSPMRTVAYALVHPGMHGNTTTGSLFDGANQTDANEVEDPAKAPLLSTYDDVVFERSFASLRSAFQCQPLIDSINMVALGLDVSEQVADMRDDNIDAAQQAIIFASIGAGVTAVETAALIIEGASEAGNAAVAWALCAATLGLAVNACAAAPQHTAAIALTGGVMAANIASIALNIVAAVKAGEALALADNEIDVSDLSCGPTPNPDDIIAAAQQEVTDATNALAQLDADILTKQGQLGAANTARTNSINNLYATVRASQASSSIDYKVTNLINAGDAWYTADANFNTAASQLTLLNDQYNNWNASVTKYNNILNNLTGPANTGALNTQINSLQTQINSLQTQIDAETDPDTKQALQLQQLSLMADREMLIRYRDSGDTTEIVTERDRAVTERNNVAGQISAAQTNYNNANSALGNANTTYQTAYSSLLNHGVYSVTNGLTTTYQCTNYAGTCPATINISSTDYPVTNRTSVVRSAIADLMGGTGNTWGASWPADDSKLVMPSVRQKELTALQGRRPAAVDRVNTANANLAQAQDAAQDMPECTITGTGVGPMPPDIPEALLINVDRKGGTR